MDRWMNEVQSFPENVNTNQKNYAVVKKAKLKDPAWFLCLLFFVLAVICFLLVFWILDNPNQTPDFKEETETMELFFYKTINSEKFCSIR